MTTIPANSKARRLTGGTAAAAALCAVLLAACGGGGDAGPDALRHGSERGGVAVASVRVEGCVVDEYWEPRTASVVHAVAADGRVLDVATSDLSGVFHLNVPARQTVTIALSGVAGEALDVPVGPANLTVGACLQHRHD
jgi:hypothetical protein